MRIKSVLFLIYCLLISLIFSSVLYSGYYYAFDPDELFHLHMVYLLFHGNIPYTSFFSTYTPIFHWLLLPIGIVWEFSSKTLMISRLIMVIVFCMRTILTGLIIKKLFGYRMMLLFIPLFLLDPFTVFTAMQIRPDNIALLFLIIGLWVKSVAHDREKNIYEYASAWFLGLSVLTCWKLVPFVGVIVGDALFQFTPKIRIRNPSYLMYFFLPFFFFLCYTLMTNSTVAMATQVLFDAKKLNDSILNPLNILNFYWPHNWLLYGPDRSSIWRFAMLLPILALSGVSLLLFGKQHASVPRLSRVIAIAFVAQFLSIFFVRCVFIQYFLTLSCWFAFFSAYMVIYIIDFYKKPITTFLILFVISLCLGILSATSIKINFQRPSAFQHTLVQLEKDWQAIPPEESVFPGYLFRSNTYPIGYGGSIENIPDSIKNRYMPVKNYLELHKTPYLMMSDSYFKYLDPSAQAYINVFYEQDKTNKQLWIRNREENK